MPNANRPMGLSPTKMITGAPYNGQVNVYTILAANTNAFAIGDPVMTDASGGDSRGIGSVTIATAVSPLRGVIVGIGTTPNLIANPANLDQTIRPAGAKPTNWYALVVDDPNVIFEVQEVGTGTALTVIDIGLNTNLVPGTNNGFVSGWQLDNATEAVTSTLQCRLLGLAQRIDNEIGQFAKWNVLINNHELRPGAAGT